MLTYIVHTGVVTLVTSTFDLLGQTSEADMFLVDIEDVKSNQSTFSMISSTSDIGSILLLPLSTGLAQDQLIVIASAGASSMTNGAASGGLTRPMQLATLVNYLSNGRFGFGTLFLNRRKVFFRGQSMVPIHFLM
eukprot:gene19564-21494_t